MVMTKAPPEKLLVLEKMEELARLIRAGLTRYEKRKDERYKESLLQVYAYLRVLVADLESVFGEGEGFGDPLLKKEGVS